MAETEKKTFPYIANKNWWELRRRWLTSPPTGPVTVSYLESALNLNEKVANGLQGQLRLVGLIDEKDKVTELALDEWRHDEDYAAACAKMLKAIYPVELIDAVPPPNPDRQAAARWFMKALGSGTVTANQKAAFYELLASGDPEAEAATPSAKPAKSNDGRSPTKPRAERRSRAPSSPAPVLPSGPLNGAALPSVHIDVQIHISADASPAQIDQVFASMATHLYKR